MTIIAVFIWLYEEHLNNQYLKVYKRIPRTGLDRCPFGPEGNLAIGVVCILLKAGKITGEIGHLPSKIAATKASCLCRSYKGVDLNPAD